MGELTPLASRDSSIGFAKRTALNLEYVESSASRGAPHVVTQTLLSVFGLVVFPWADGVDAGITGLSYTDLVADGWPEWELTLGEAETLGELVRHLRNAVAHRRFRFFSDDSDLAKVTVEFHDAPAERAPASWRAKIRADGLRMFCIRFANLVDDTLG